MSVVDPHTPELVPPKFENTTLSPPAVKILEEASRAVKVAVMVDPAVTEVADAAIVEVETE